MSIIDWFYMDIEEVTKDKNKYEGLDSVKDPTPYDFENIMVPADGLQIGADQYIVCVDGGDIQWGEDFDDLIKTR